MVVRGGGEGGADGKGSHKYHEPGFI
jgi:hypothetical protein